MTQKMYSRTTNPQPTQKPKRPPTPSEERASRLYRNSKKQGLWLGESRLVVSGEVVRKWEQGAWTAVGDRADEMTGRIKKDAIELAEAVGDDMGARILGHSIKAELAEVRRTGEKPDAEAEATAKRNNGEAMRRRLQDTYGTERAREILDRVRKFIRNTPAVARVLSKHGLEEKPEVVSELAEHVLRVNYR